MKPELEHVLSLLPEDTRAAAKELFEKNPEFAAGFLRQSDYDANLDRMKKEHAEKLKLVEQGEQRLSRAVEDWNTSKKAYDEQVETMRNASQPGTRSAEETIADLETQGAPAEETKKLAKELEELRKSIITKKDLDELGKSVGAEIEAKYWKQGFPAAVNAAQLRADIAARHRRDFNEELNWDELENAAKGTEVKFGSLQALYDYHTRDKRQAKAFDDRLKKEVAEAQEKVRQEERARLTQGAAFPAGGPVGRAAWMQAQNEDEAASKARIEKLRLGEDNTAIAREMLTSFGKQGKVFLSPGNEGSSG